MNSYREYYRRFAMGVILGTLMLAVGVMVMEVFDLHWYLDHHDLASIVRWLFQ